MGASSTSRRDYPLIDWAGEVEHLSQLRYTSCDIHIIQVIHPIFYKKGGEPDLTRIIQILLDFTTHFK